MKGFKEKFFGKQNDENDSKMKTSTADSLLEKLAGVKGRMEEDRKQRSNPCTPKLPRRNCSREGISESPLATPRSRRRILPEIEIKPGTPDNDLRQSENSLVPPSDEVKKVEELTTEVLPRRSREEKVLEIIESGEFIEKISPQVRRKFATPEDWIGNKASTVAKWIRESDESKSLDIRERQKVKKMLTSLDIAKEKVELSLADLALCVKSCIHGMYIRELLIICGASSCFQMKLIFLVLCFSPLSAGIIRERRSFYFYQDLGNVLGKLRSLEVKEKKRRTDQMTSHIASSYSEGNLKGRIEETRRNPRSESRELYL
ncbi:Oidioi.mRNA.OKI2018_I69.XSR.g15381.t1.cds [Oikopleura dioica]|uniref:Oidioi.mRNA.OKI2018_I69.XSR.g15381.t1.cds n=1 Tax=Oikopleura dioica TaxID=34765 RepID=A0ABN7SJ34_OIKDI|nr:Oidioi.mRNA.OKI2018_I69.XSR.g15381.t1.cds [Oikopleura dioica]